MTTIDFILNPISGTQNKAAILALIEQMVDKGRFDYRILRTEYSGHGYELAKQSVEEGIQIIVAIGGDGTINEVGRAVVHSSSALGIIPCGSGNGLARHVGIPMNAKGALRTILQGRIVVIDYGKIDNRPFFCTCGMGFDAFVSMKFAESGKRGIVSYIENTLNTWLSYKPEVYEIEDEQGTKHCKAFLIACANASQYGNNAYIAPQASLTDGVMDIVIMKPFTVLDIPSLSFQLFNKLLNQNSHVEQFQSKKIIIHRQHEGVFHFDGDPVHGGKDLTVEIIEKGLNMVVPAQPAKRLPAFNFTQLLEEMVGQPISLFSLPNWQRELRRFNVQLRRRLLPKRK